jgi:hypothetical protein
MTYTTTPATMHSGHDIRDASGSMVAIVHNPASNPAEGARIAALMAAAPEMLAALQAAVNLLSWGEAFNSDLPDATTSEKNAAKKVDEFKALITRAQGAAQ